MLLMRKKSGTLFIRCKTQHFLPLKVQNDFKDENQLVAETSFETIDHFLICDIFFVSERVRDDKLVVACKAKIL